MKYLFLILLSILLTDSLSAQTRLREHPDFRKIAAEHQTIAIMPFRASVSLRPNQRKELTLDQLRELEVAEGKAVQHSMYRWFMYRKAKGKLRVEVHKPSTTYDKLLKAGISQENHADYSPQELAEILGVDAIIMGTLRTNKPMSEGASTALGIVTGVWGATVTAYIDLSIYNAQDGILLLSYQKKVRGTMGDTTHDLINRLMQKVSRRIAYAKE